MTPSPYHTDRYDAWMRSWGASPRTRSVRVNLAHRLAALWPDPDVVTDEDVTAFLAHPGYSDWTRATYFGHLRSIFGWLAETGLIVHDPTSRLRRPPSGPLRPRDLTPAEAARARAAATGSTHAALMLGLFAGLRAFEVAELHSRQVTRDAIYVVGKGGREAHLPTHPLIWDLASTRSGYWFPARAGGHVDARMISKRVSRLFASLGIEGSFHRCRHYYGTSLLRAGVNIRVVQELMRHASLATTAAYLGVGEDEKRAAVMALAA